MDNRFLLALIVVLFLSVVVGVQFFHRSYDDAFITYRYARNLAEGHGYVYNIGDRQFGTTALLYGLVLALLGYGHASDIPTISGIISGLSVFASCLALLVLGRRHDGVRIAFLASVFYLLNPVVHCCFGSEVLPQIALTLWAFVLYDRGRSVPAALLLLTAVLVRLDALAAMGLLALHFVVTRRKFPWRESLLVSGGLAAMALGCHAYFGRILPATIASKTAQLESGGWVGMLTGTLRRINQSMWGGEFRMFGGPAFCILCLVGAAFIHRYRFFFLPLAWGAIQMLAYVAIGAPFYPWYILPLMLGISLAAAAGVEGIFYLGSLSRYTRTASAAAVTVLLVVFAAVNTVHHPFETNYPGVCEERMVRYVQAGKWIAAHTPPDCTVGYNEIGWLGYYAERPMIDSLGLIHPEVARHVAQGDFLWMFRQRNPDIVVSDLHYGPSYEELMKQPWFPGHYRKIAEIPGRRWEPIVLYGRNDLVVHP